MKFFPLLATFALLCHAAAETETFTDKKGRELSVEIVKADETHV